MMHSALATAVLGIGLLHTAAQASRGLPDSTCSDRSSGAAALMQRPLEKKVQHHAEDTRVNLRPGRSSKLNRILGSTGAALAARQVPVNVAYAVTRDVWNATLRSMLSLGLHNKAPNLVIHLLVPESEAEAVHDIVWCFRRQLSAAHLDAGIPPVQIIPLNGFPIDIDYAWNSQWANAGAASTAKLCLDEHLQVERVLYLDADTLVLADVSPLFEGQMNHALGAVADVKTFGDRSSWKCPQGEVEQLVDVSKMEFNGGVLLQDLKRWKEENITGSLAELARTIPCLAKGDQLLLNIIFQQSTERGFDQLGGEWNKQIWADEFNEFHVDLHEQKIIHFTANKPWDGSPGDDKVTRFLEQFREWWTPGGGFADTGSECAEFVL